MIGRLYELAWRPTTKRPWTFQIRDWASHHPYRVWPIVALCVVVFVGLQMVAPMELGWWALPVVLFADFLAFLAAHLWWGGGETRPVSDFG
jgi:hypothetical protein